MFSTARNFSAREGLRDSAPRQRLIGTATGHRRRLLVVNALLVLLVNCATFAVHATDFLVTTAADETTPGNGCSLREAVENTAGGAHPDCPVASAPDNIFFDDGIATIALSAPLTLTGNVSIFGDGQVTLDGQSSSQIIIANASGGGSNLLSDITLTRGRSATHGGCISNSALLYLTGVTLTQCYAQQNGGAVYTTSAVILTRSTVDDNEANTSSISAGGGGGIYGNSGQVRLNDSTVSNNRARVGGGVFVTAAAYFFNATLAGNSATESGGGVYYTNGNTANRIYLHFSTFAYNAANTGGSAIQASGTIYLYKSLVAGNTGSSNCTTSGATGAVSDQGYNLDDGTSCGFSAVGSINSANMAGLGPLQDNGGATYTISSAFTAATDAAICDLNQVPRDQRGANRPFGANCDIGAYEYVKYTLTYRTSGAGSLDVGGNLVGMWSEIHDFDEDGSSILAVPQAGYRLVRWSDGSTDNPRIDTHVHSDIDVTAEFLPWEITPDAPLPTGVYGVTYPLQQFSVMGGIAPLTFDIAGGSLPPGIGLDAHGKLSGTPTLPGGYSFNLRVTDNSGAQVVEPYDLTVNRAPQQIEFDPGDWDVYLDPGDEFDLATYTTVSSGLTPVYTVDNPGDGVCSSVGSVLIMLDEGYCDFSIDQPGNMFFLPDNYSDSLYFFRATIFADGLEDSL